jgi:hypothetical protein
MVVERYVELAGDENQSISAFKSHVISFSNARFIEDQQQRSYTALLRHSVVGLLTAISVRHGCL